MTSLSPYLPFSGHQPERTDVEKQDGLAHVPCIRRQAGDDEMSRRRDARGEPHVVQRWRRADSLQPAREERHDGNYARLFGPSLFVLPVAKCLIDSTQLRTVPVSTCGYFKYFGCFLG